jgi:hypothetical protein
MRLFAPIAALGAALSLAACGGGESGGNAAAHPVPGQSANAADGINTSADASGTTGSTTGDAGGPLNVAGDAANDSAGASSAGGNEH